MPESMERTCKESALTGINVAIDMSTYDFLEVYVGGRRLDKNTISKFFGLKKREAEDEMLERVLIMAGLNRKCRREMLKVKSPWRILILP